jgi:hypothetical protein
LAAGDGPHTLGQPVDGALLAALAVGQFALLVSFPPEHHLILQHQNPSMNLISVA